jgi:hypothetical protein
MRASSKNYKTTLYNEYNIYQQQFADDLRKISKTHSKSFWKILNSIRDEKKNDSNSDITLNSLYEHLKKINVNDIDEDENE